jgi:rRNA maturation RNase YbeY
MSKGELSIAFLDKAIKQNFHWESSSDSTLTDVITFVDHRQMNFVGKICISPDYFIGNYKTYGITFSKELNLYLIHEYLHIYGLNDISQDEAKKCEREHLHVTCE